MPCSEIGPFGSLERESNQSLFGGIQKLVAYIVRDLVVLACAKSTSIDIQLMSAAIWFSISIRN